MAEDYRLLCIVPFLVRWDPDLFSVMSTMGMGTTGGIKWLAEKYGVEPPEHDHDHRGLQRLMKAIEKRGKIQEIFGESEVRSIAPG